MKMHFILFNFLRIFTPQKDGICCIRRIASAFLQKKSQQYTITLIDITIIKGQISVQLLHFTTHSRVHITLNDVTHARDFQAQTDRRFLCCDAQQQSDRNAEF